MEMLIKLPKDAVMIQRYKKVLRNYFNLLHAEKRFRSVILIADVDAN
jgi:primosomal protein N' (replication factor Y)